MLLPTSVANLVQSRDELVHETLLPHCGSGVLLNNDGGSGGYWMCDFGPSQSPYAKAAREISTAECPVLHAGVDHTAKQ